MKAVYNRVTREEIAKGERTWVKTVYIFGIKMFVWDYALKEDKEKKLGFSNNKG